MKELFENYSIVLIFTVMMTVVGVVGFKGSMDANAKENESKDVYEECLQMSEETFGLYSVYVNGTKIDNKNVSLASMKPENYSYDADYARREIYITKKEVNSGSGSRSHDFFIPVFLHR